MLSTAFALLVVLLLTLSCAAPQSTAPALSPLPDTTVTAPAEAGTVEADASAMVSPTPAPTAAPPATARIAATPPPFHTVAPPAAGRAAATPLPAPVPTVDSAVAARAALTPTATPTPRTMHYDQTPLAELGLTAPEAVAELARRYRVSPERIDYQQYETTILDAGIAPVPDSQDLMLTATTRLRNDYNLLDGFKISTFDDAIYVTIYEFDFCLYCGLRRAGQLLTP